MRAKTKSLAQATEQQSRMRGKTREKKGESEIPIQNKGNARGEGERVRV